LEHASGYFRSELATRLDLRIFPRLRFHWDPTPERAAQIEQLIAELHQEASNETGGKSGSFDFAQDGPVHDEEGGEDG
jgi:hypothetical protein